MTSILKTRKTHIKAKPRVAGDEPTNFIIISCEGAVTEDVYFIDIVQKLYPIKKSRLQLVSARETYYSSDIAKRTQADMDEQNRSNPKAVLKRLEDYLEKNKRKLNLYPDIEDEYWLVLDIDHHTSEQYIAEWESVLGICRDKNYYYAVSNPFFEIWLLLHHTDATEEDKTFAVNENNPYKKTNHFKKRLLECNVHCLGASLSYKEPLVEDYSIEKIQDAIHRANILDNRKDHYPKEFGSTVYILLQHILDKLQ